MNTITDLFPRGEANTAYAAYFTGNSWLSMLSTEGVVIGNVTFEPGCRNHWHTHHAARNGGQILLCTAGRGWYQAWGSPARELHPGDVVIIPAGRSVGQRIRRPSVSIPRSHSCSAMLVLPRP